MSVSHRKIGSTGGHQVRLVSSFLRFLSNVYMQDPGRVWPGKKMPGRMGNVRRTIQNLEVVRIDTSLDLIFVKGSVPGVDDAHVMVRDAKKKMLQNSQVNYLKGRDEKVLPRGVDDLPFPAGTQEMAALLPPIIEAPSKRITSPFTPRT